MKAIVYEKHGNPEILQLNVLMLKKSRKEPIHNSDTPIHLDKNNLFMTLANFITYNSITNKGRAIMEIDLKSESDLEKAYKGRYYGVDVNLRRISNEAKARRGEYEGFGTYLRRISKKAKARRNAH